jgi:hypothetical protein
VQVVKFPAIPKTGSSADLEDLLFGKISISRHITTVNGMDMHPQRAQLLDCRVDFIFGETQNSIKEKKTVLFR